MLGFTVSQKNILNSLLLAIDGSSSHRTFRIETTSGFLGPRVTTVIELEDPGNSDSQEQLRGKIDWREGTFEINGFLRRVRDMTKNHGDIFGSAKLWSWQNQRYIVEFSEDELMAMRYPETLPSGMYTPRRTWLFRGAEPACIEISPSIPPDGRVLLIMAFIWTVTPKPWFTTGSGFCTPLTP